MNDLWGNRNFNSNGMNFGNNGMNNGMMGGNGYFRNNNYAPHFEITRVNGVEGAKSFQMGPNSNYLLLDNTAPIIWFVQTDGAGLLTPTPYDISPHMDIPPVDINELARKVAQLEEKINNGQSNFSSNKQSKKQRQQSTTVSDGSTNDSTN